MEKTINSSEQQVLLELLRESREAYPLTQGQLSERIGMSQSDVSKVERGVRRLDVIELRTWVLALDMSLAGFVAELEARFKRQDALSRQARKRAKP